MRREPGGRGNCLSMRIPAVLVATVLAVTACGQSASRHAHTDRVLYVYNWADYIGKDTIRSFEKQTGIRVVYDTYDAGEELEAKLLAGDAGYDVVTTSADYFSRQIKAGVYQPLEAT